MPWVLVSGTFVVGLALLAVGRLRAARGSARLEEAVPECRIGELEPGRYRVLGRVVPLATSKSEVDGLDCVYIERAEYRVVGVGIAPLLKEVQHQARCHPFYLDDGTGRVLVDPATTLIECATASGDEGLTVERRLRAGEEIALTATFGPADTEGEEAEGPYRGSARRWRPTADEVGPPRISYRTAGEMIAPPPDQLSGFLGGAGALMLFFGGLLAFVAAFAG